MWLNCMLPSLCLSLSYVFSLYVWRSVKALDRDHPETIRRRFLSAFFMIFVAITFVYLFGVDNEQSVEHVAHVVGVRSEGLMQAAFIPLFLTMVLFLGPLCMSAYGDARFLLLSTPSYWLHCLSDLIWWRNHVVAPFSEEFTFRACLLPILLKCIDTKTAVIVAPLFFGVAHVHHMWERVRKGLPWRTALFISLFQIHYTTVFGMYSAFLFVRTGHLLGPVVVHGFCNFMGFPDFGELLNQKPKPRLVFSLLFLLGVILFYLLLFPLTQPYLYSNQLYKWDL